MSASWSGTAHLHLRRHLGGRGGAARRTLLLPYATFQRFSSFPAALTRRSICHPFALALPGACRPRFVPLSFAHARRPRHAPPDAARRRARAAPGAGLGEREPAPVDFYMAIRDALVEAEPGRGMTRPARRRRCLSRRPPTISTGRGGSSAPPRWSSARATRTRHPRLCTYRPRARADPEGGPPAGRPNRQGAQARALRARRGLHVGPRRGRLPAAAGASDRRVDRGEDRLQQRRRCAAGCGRRSATRVSGRA